MYLYFSPIIRQLKGYGKILGVQINTSTSPCRLPHLIRNLRAFHAITECDATRQFSGYEKKVQNKHGQLYRLQNQSSLIILLKGQIKLCMLQNYLLLYCILVVKASSSTTIDLSSAICRFCAICGYHIVTLNLAQDWVDLLGLGLIC